MNLKETVELLLKSGRTPKTESIGGLTLVLIPEGDTYRIQVPLQPGPRRPSLHVKTLASLVDFLAANMDASAAVTGAPGESGLDWGGHALFVDATDVELWTSIDPNYPIRDMLFRTAPAVVEEYKFGQYLEQEEFILALRTRFEDFADLQALIAVVSKVATTGTEMKIMDDGITQEVNVRKGTVQLERGTLPSIVNLAPYRTFREIQQPVSPFLLRTKLGAEGKPPVFTLMEVNPGKWRLDAIDAIRDFLSSATAKAGVKIHIFA